MRNLRNIGQSIFALPPSSATPITASCWDVARDELVVAYGPTADEARIELVRLSRDGSFPSYLNARTIASWDAPSVKENSEADVILSLHHSSDTFTTCVIMAGGDIMTIREDDDDSVEAHIEIVGTLSPSIVAARWSPDEELLVIATGDAKVFFMSRSFDVIIETALTGDDLKMSKHVSVGWGKKETQFQGKGAKAKALRDPTIPEKVDEGRPSPNDDGRCTISWRGDGAYVAVNLLQEGVRRVIRVYNRDGELDSVTEPVDGLEGSLSWRPSGNLMAGIQRFSNRVDVVFFERNGLRHGQFTLRVPENAPDPAENLALEWNSDSTVLAVIFKDRVQLWTTGNYHWYLKQEVLCGQAPAEQGQGQLPLFSWHTEKPLLFAASTAEKVLLNEYIFTVARGPATPPHDHGAVAVIDGRTIKFTPFRTANVPPPYAFSELELASPAIDVAFSKDGSFMAVLHQVGVSFFALEAKGPRLLPPTLVETALFGLEEFQLYEESLLQISFSGPTEVQVVQIAGGLGLLSYEFAREDKQWTRTVNSETIAAISSFEAGSAEGIVSQDRLGKLTLFSNEGTTPLDVRFPAFLPWSSFVMHNEQILAFGLSRNGHLYANSRQLVKNCTSFVVTNSHLIFTTSNHLVKFVHLASVDELDVPADDPENDERCRSIERGGRLVAAMPTKMSIVLQMPRGNLETIFPRAMVLAGIRQLVEEKDYGSAFATCRTQRVDMNIVYDHRPEQFLANVDLFLDQIRDAANIDLFLSTLKDEDVSQTMYRDTKSSAAAMPATQQQPEATVKPGKINTICDAVLQKLKTKKNANLQNIITANVVKSPPALDDGLLVVAELMQEDEALAERAVEHICFLADVNTLYDHALGLYNLDLTLLVAQQSQRDPREYLPFIQELHKMPVLRRQFTIDDKLNKRDKALDSLKALADFEEASAYTVKHKLFQHALKIYRLEQAHHRTLTNLYAAHLRSTSQFREAGLAYESLGNFTDATDCYLKAGASCWRECLYVAQQQLHSNSLTTDQFQEIASTLAEALREAKEYSSAATIHADYLESIESAVSCLCKGYLFADALRLVTRHNRPDLLEKGVDQGLTEAFSSSTEFLADCKAQLKAQVPRIAELRKKAREDPLAFYEGENPFGSKFGGGVDIPDDVSVAASSRMSTNASLFTRYTGKNSVGTVASNVSRATSKNRKREEKKRARGRKGTVYEEEYLVNSVRRLVERVERAKGEVERLVFGLARRGMPEQARNIEELMGEVLEGCRMAVKEVWPQQVEGAEVSVAAGEQQGDGEEYGYGYRATGGDAVLQDSLEATRAKQTPPVVGKFERLALLGGR